MVKNTKNNQPYWLENLKKAISYVNSEDFLTDLESGKYETDKKSIIYLNLEDGTVSMTPVFGATLKTVKLSFWNVQRFGRNNFTIQNGIDVTLERFNKFVSDLISELTPTLKSKSHISIVRGEYPFCMFDKTYQKKAWDRILVELFNQDFNYLGFDDVFDCKEFSFKKILSQDTSDLFFESFYCDDHRELTSRMFLYKKYNEISEEAAIAMLDKFKEKIIHQNKVKFSPSAYYFDCDIPESDTFFDVPVEMAFDLLSKFKSVKFRLGDDVCEPSIWPEMTSKLIDFWVRFSKKITRKSTLKVDNDEFTEYLKFGEGDPKKFIYFNKQMSGEHFARKRGMFTFEDLEEYYQTLIKHIS